MAGPAEATKPFSKQRAVLIGAHEYQHVKPLQYCGKDVRDLAQLFRSSLDFDKSDVLEFTAESALRPERSIILHNVGEFLKRDIKPDELLLFYFSGHGMMEAGDDFLLPVDASPNELGDTGISVTKLTKRLVDTGCRNIVMFIDACREDLAGAKSGVSIGEASKAALERDGIVTFFSCDPRERSYEIGELQQGSFTHCLMNAINRGDCSTVEAIDRYLRDNVPLINQKYSKPLQRPFTIVKPAEKLQLAIFYSENRREAADDRYIAYQVKLADIVAQADELEPSTYNAAIEFLERLRQPCTLSPDDKRRLAFVERLCSGTFTPRSFQLAWEASFRAASKPPNKSLR